MTTLVVGASGATGRLLVEQLLNQGEKVRVIVRSIDRLPELIKNNKRVSVTEANLLDMTDSQLLEQVQGCRAVASCLGHNLTCKGMFGHPRRLVTDGVKRLCYAIEKAQSDSPIKFILMNTTGNQNKQAGEKVSTAQSIIIGLIRMLIPPHVDNEQAAAYLQSNFELGDKSVEWATVRPDSLLNEESISQFNIYPSPIRSAIFDSGKTSRINVAHFMSQLITNNDIWEKWKHQMPVIYNT
ncbi:MAG: NAD(P)-dependent dehydrogenase (short-subunit alcohol dehydrogenase family) [Bacteroidia bacterium]|jgi:NAD(P)-dependent dehydrogenase (short-subunit alcohol dehydrogenase family)